jgi:hypothetical protein
MSPTIKIAFSNFWHPPTPEGVRDNALFQLLSRRFSLELSDRPDFLIYSCFKRRCRPFRHHDCIRIFYTGENVPPDMSQCDYSFGFGCPTSDRQYRLPLYRLYFDQYKLIHVNREAESFTGGQRKFCNFVYSNPNCRQRNHMFRLLNGYKPVDAGGRLFNTIGEPVKDKLAFQRGYRFTIAFENESAPGYTTEKLLHALVAGTVPIYWGNPLVARDFNPRAFINCHDFDCFEDVVDRVRQVDRDESLYRSYLAEPIFPGGIEPEYLREEAILGRFAEIFSGGKRFVKPRRSWWRRGRL